MVRSELLVPARLTAPGPLAHLVVYLPPPAMRSVPSSQGTLNFAVRSCGCIGTQTQRVSLSVLWLVCRIPTVPGVQGSAPHSVSCPIPHTSCLPFPESAQNENRDGLQLPLNTRSGEEREATWSLFTGYFLRCCQFPKPNSKPVRTVAFTPVPATRTWAVAACFLGRRCCPAGLREVSIGFLGALCQRPCDFLTLPCITKFVFCSVPWGTWPVLYVSGTCLWRRSLWLLPVWPPQISLKFIFVLGCPK